MFFRLCTLLRCFPSHVSLSQKILPLGQKGWQEEVSQIRFPKGVAASHYFRDTFDGGTLMAGNGFVHFLKCRSNVVWQTVTVLSCKCCIAFFSPSEQDKARHISLAARCLPAPCEGDQAVAEAPCSMFTPIRVYNYHPNTNICSLSSWQFFDASVILCI